VRNRQYGGSSWKAFSLLRFFFAVWKKNEVPPRTRATQIDQHEIKFNEARGEQTAQTTVHRRQAKSLGKPDRNTQHE
jgi:hypothetical protein